MPSIKNKALLLNVDVFLAENNIRRGISSFAVNAQAEDQAFREQSLIVPANTTKTYASLHPNTLTVVRTTKPLQVTMQRGEDASSFVINSIWIFSSAFDALVMNNEGSEDAQVFIVQV
jgi:hypothetical protein